MNRSLDINLLAQALAQAQGSMTHAKKDSENPHFRSKYADPEPWPDETFDPEEQLSEVDWDSRIKEAREDDQREADRWHGRAG